MRVLRLTLRTSPVLVFTVTAFAPSCLCAPLLRTNLPVFRIDRSPLAALCRGDDDAVAETICRARAEHVQKQIFYRDMVDIIVVMIQEDRSGMTGLFGCTWQS